MILIEQNFGGIQSTASDDGKKLYMAGTFMEHSVKNRNGRIYAPDDMKLAINQINEAARSGQHILCELDHPPTLEVSLKNVSHKLVEARMDGTKVWCKAEVLDQTPQGQILRSLIESGINVGVSSRGSGSVNESTGQVRDYRFVCVDAVARPSCRSAYPETLREQFEMDKRGGVITDLSEAAIHDPRAQKFLQDEMLRFFRKL